MTRYLVGSIVVTCRSKIAKILPIGNPRWPPWPPSWKPTFRFFSWTERPIDSKLARKHWVTCRSKIAKIVPIENPRWLPWQPSWKSTFRFFSWTERPIDSGSEIQDGRHLENLFFASSPEPKDQLTPNLLGSIGVTCGSKIAKIMPFGNPRWPPWQPSWKSIFLLNRKAIYWLQTCKEASGWLVDQK